MTNLAAVTGMTLEEITDSVEEFKERLPALANLIAALERAGRKFGNLLAVDGRWARIRFKNGDLLVHTILNVLLQTTGSLCMKWGMVFAEDQLREEGVALDELGFPMFLANQHDELQIEIPKEEVQVKEYLVPAADWKEEEKAVHYDQEGRMWSAPNVLKGDAKKDPEVLVQRKYHRAGQILAETMTKAGEYLGIRIPLAGEYKIGNSWAETH